MIAGAQLVERPADDGDQASDEGRHEQGAQLNHQQGDQYAERGQRKAAAERDHRAGGRAPQRKGEAAQHNARNQQREREHHDNGEHHCRRGSKEAEHRAGRADCQPAEQRDPHRDRQQYQHGQQPRGHASPAAFGFAGCAARRLVRHGGQLAVVRENLFGNLFRRAEVGNDLLLVLRPGVVKVFLVIAQGAGAFLLRQAGKRAPQRRHVFVSAHRSYPPKKIESIPFL